MQQHDTLWKAAPDVFIVTAPAVRLIDAAADAVSALRLTSHDPGVGFHMHTRRTTAAAGPALVVSDVAEPAGGERHTAVVVSLVVDHDAAPGGGRRALIRTHLEDGHTQVSGSGFTFERHHDMIRAALVQAVRRVDRRTLHVESPTRPDRDRPPVAAVPPITVERARQKRPTHGAGALVVPRSGVDGRSFAGLALMAVGIATMVMAVATGTFQLGVGGVALGLLLGWVGSRLDGI